jgi:phage head maturation protease
VIGSIDPSTMREEPRVGLHVRGQLDLESSETAREVWRLMKRNVVGLSFGFLTTASHTDGEVKVIDEVDLFEITVTAAPANADTRVLDMKSADGASRGLNDLGRSRQCIADLTLDELIKRGNELTKDIDIRPVQIKSFEC